MSSWPQVKIGHGGLKPLPPQSPDQSPLNFFFWGYIKDYISTPPMPQSMLELQSQILELTAQVKVAMLQSTWEEFQYHLDIYCLTHGTHTERLLEKT
jgi:hypothetical protein